MQHIAYSGTGDNADIVLHSQLPPLHGTWKIVAVLACNLYVFSISHTSSPCILFITRYLSFILYKMQCDLWLLFTKQLYYYITYVRLLAGDQVVWCHYYYPGVGSTIPQNIMDRVVARFIFCGVWNVIQDTFCSAEISYSGPANAILAGQVPMGLFPRWTRACLVSKKLILIS